MRPDEPPAAARMAIPALAALTLVAALLRLPWLTAEGLWFDEVFSVVLASQDVPELMRRALGDQTNPPGFYLLLWGWVRLGSFDEAWLRLLPALAGILTPPAIGLLVRELGGTWRSVLLAGTLAAASPLLLAMSLEVRAYAPLALLTTVGLLLALRIATPVATPVATRGGTAATIGALVMIDLLLVSLHYFGALAIVAQFAVLADARVLPGRRMAVARTLILAGLPAALLLGGWLLAVIDAAPEGRLASNASWIPESGWRGVLRFATHHAIGDLDHRWAALVLGALLGAAILLPFFRDARSAGGARVAALATLLPLVTVLVADAITPRALWVPRYLVFTIPPLLVTLALVIERLGVTARDLLASTLAGWALMAGLHDIRARPQKPDWTRVLTELARGAPATLCINEPFIGLPLEYYAIRERLPVRVLDMRRCEAGAGRSWVVYRPGTESSFGAVVARGARLGPRVSLGTELPPTEARPLDWPRR